MRTPKLTPLTFTVLTSLVFVSFIYAARLVTWRYELSLDIEFRTDVLCAPWVFICLAGIFWVGIIGVIFPGIVVLSVLRTRSALPFLALAAVLLGAFLLPMPSQIPTPEHLHFLEFQAEYLRATRLIIQEYSKPNHVYFCDPRYKEAPFCDALSAMWSIDGYRHTQFGWIIEFYPFDDLYPLTYVELDGEKLPCDRSNRFFVEAIQPHWYVCKRDWFH